MGAAQPCSKGKQWSHGRLVDDDNYDDYDGSANVFMVCVALDYKGCIFPTGQSAELTSTVDGNNMLDLWRACNLPAANVIKLFDRDATKEGVIDAVQRIGERAQEGDYFIFFYSGHGTSVLDTNFDETDGVDEALCLVDDDGQLSWLGMMGVPQSSFLIDDELAELFTNSFDEGVKIINICDCCHSGTISDFDSADWGNLAACSVTGCADSELGNDSGNGGYLTHSLLMAIHDFNSPESFEDKNDDYSVGQLYNMTQRLADEHFEAADLDQHITTACSKALESPSDMRWPLIPVGQYTAPYRK